MRIFVVVVAALALAACSAQDPEVTANDQVPADQQTSSSTEGATATEDADGATFVAVDIAFEAAPETIPAGTTEVVLENNGSAPHDVTIEQTDTTVVSANGGESATGTVELEAGTYTYFCSVPGHREAGMEGELTVE